MNHKPFFTRLQLAAIPKGLGIGLAITVLVAGWLVPEFYDWTGADQSRPAPVVPWIAAAIVATDLLVILALLGLHWADQGEEATASRRPWQFSFRELLVLTTLAAVLLGVGSGVSPYLAVMLVFGCTAVWAVWVAIRGPAARWWIALTAWSQFAPYVWVVRKLDSSGDVSTFVQMFPGLPSLVPWGFLGALFGGHPQDGWWFLILFTAATLSAGVWVSGLGPKRALAFGLVTATCSIFGSFILNALMRA
jgi:hypothetical protein